MAGNYDNITDAQAAKEAEEMKRKEAERKASGGNPFWDRIKKNMGGKTEKKEVSGGGSGHGFKAPAEQPAKTAQTPEPAAPAKKDTISNSIEAQANAKPGDIVNGRALTQGDIDWAKNKLGMNAQPEEAPAETGMPETSDDTTEAGYEEDVSTSEGIDGSNIDAPEIVEAKPDLASPEVQKAIGAGGAEIEDASGDPTKQEAFTQKYCDAIWENYDKGMAKQPKFKPGWQLPATILSIGLSVFSGGLVPPVNFMKLTGKEDEYNAALDMWKETMGKSGDLAQEQEKASTMPTAKAEGMQGAEGVASQSAIDQAAEVNAAEQGAQATARLGTEGALETMAKQAEIDYAKLNLDQANQLARLKLEQANKEAFAKLDANLQKDIADNAAALQIEIADAAAGNDIAKIQKLYEQTINQNKDIMQSLGYPATPDGFLKFMRNTGATSNAQARIKQALDIADTAGNVAGTVVSAMSPIK